MEKGKFIDTGKSTFIKRRIPRKLKKKCKKDLTLWQVKLPAIRQMLEYVNRSSLMTLLSPAIDIGKQQLYCSGIDAYDKDSKGKSFVA